MSRTTNSQSPSGRPRRTPVGTRNKLTVANRDPNFEYRIVNDVDNRIAEFQDAGWELVDKSEVRVGDRRVESASPEGSKAQISVGGGVKAFVMRIKKEWFNEDQAAKQARLNELEETMFNKARSDRYGKLEVTTNLQTQTE
jgi:hypothetical protein